MFEFLKRKKEEPKKVNVRAFVEGDFVPLEEVSDPVFAQKMLGDGFALEPTDGRVKAPIAGRVNTVFPTKHAIGITTDDGIEVLLHLGFDTVTLEGKPFSSNVKEGDRVEVGDLLSTMDVEMIRQSEEASTTCALVFTNGQDKIANLDYEASGHVQVSDIVCTVTLK